MNVLFPDYDTDVEKREETEKEAYISKTHDGHVQRRVAGLLLSPVPQQRRHRV
jgi:hypothetical protein